jgi:hypothetical protein
MSLGASRPAVILVLAWLLATARFLRLYTDAVQPALLLLVPLHTLFYTVVLTCGLTLMDLERDRTNGVSPAAVGSQLGADGLYTFLIQGACVAAAGTGVAFCWAFYLKRLHPVCDGDAYRRSVVACCVAQLFAGMAAYVGTTLI